MKCFPLHHVFVFTAPGAPEADALLDVGLVEGSPNTHPGQGTANRRFFFRNAMLELLWVHDVAEARRLSVARLGLYERWRGRDGGASPFGVCLGPSRTDPAARAFAGWEYQPAYLPPELAIRVAEGPLDEPLAFQLSFTPRSGEAHRSTPEPVDHPAGLGELSHLRITSPVVELSPTAGELEAVAPITFAWGDAHVMTLTFDGGQAGRVADLRPMLPLVLDW